MAVVAVAGGSEWFYPEGPAPPFSAGTGAAPCSSSPAMAFTFAAFCYMLALLLTAALIFFAIWHVSSRGRGEEGGERLAPSRPGLAVRMALPAEVRAPGDGAGLGWRSRAARVLRPARGPGAAGPAGADAGAGGMLRLCFYVGRARRYSSRAGWGARS